MPTMLASSKFMIVAARIANSPSHLRRSRERPGLVAEVARAPTFAGTLQLAEFVELVECVDVVMPVTLPGH
jgi:hypothetical protein